MDVAQAVAQGLASTGVRRVFGNPGTTESALLHALDASGVVFTLCLTEAAAVAMADGYQRRSGEPSAVVVHTAAGAAAAQMAMLNAYGDRQPIVVLAGDKDVRLHGRGHVAESPDFAGMMAGSAKYVAMCAKPGEVLESLTHGFAAAWSRPRGPAFISVTEDCWSRTCDRAPGNLLPVDPVPAPDRRQVATVGDLLMSSRNPVILFGNQFGANPDFDAAISVATACGAAVVDELQHAIASVNYPQSRPEYLGPVCSGHPALAGADLVVVLGSSLAREYSPLDTEILPRGVRVVHLSDVRSDLAEDEAVTLSVHARAKDFVQELAVALGPTCTLAEPDRGAHSAADAVGSPLEIRTLFETVRAHLDEVSTVVAEAVLSTRYLHRWLPLDRPHGYYSTTSAGLGWGAAFAAGVALAEQDAGAERRVLCVIGDGSLAFGAQSLWNGAAQGLPITYLVINNGGYQAVQGSLLRTGSPESTERLTRTWTLSPWFSPARLAAAFNVPSSYPATGTALSQHLSRSATGPVLLDAQVVWPSREAGAQ